MKKLLSSLEKLNFPNWSIPLALLAVCGLAFGLLIPKLGFYQDDWHFVYYAYSHGAEALTELLNYDGHPLAAPIYVASFKLLGVNPLNWQLYSLFWRWLAVVTFWLVLHRLWPTQRRVTFTAAAIYIVYPLYFMQPMAITYFEVWISHFLLAASFLLTIEALKQPKRFLLFTSLAILLKVLHTVTSEYTWGMELARPFFIWLALPVIENETFRQRLTHTLRISAPYLLIFGLAMFWRGFLYRSPVLSRSEPRLFEAILADPLGGIQHLVLNVIPDMVLILFSTWYSTLNPKMLAFTDRFNLQALGLVMFSTIGLGLYLSRLESKHDPTEKNTWIREAFLPGAAILIFGMIPAYAAGYFVFLKLEPWNGRFVMGSMPGVALLTTIFIEALIDAPKKRWWAAALLISLGIGWQIRMTNNFRWAWEAETDFYQQLVLRVPAIAPNTAFISDNEFLGLMGDYPTAFALNSLYADPLGIPGREASTWLFLVNSNFNGQTGDLLKKMPLVAEKHSTRFDGNSSNSLVISYEPELGQCLWLVTPENAEAQIVPETLRKISPLSNLTLIQPTTAPRPFLQTILPHQPDRWCTHYQRGALAKQLKDWDKTIAEWETAAKNELRPANGFEYLPFIEAYGQSANWEQAYTLTRSANKVSKGMEDVLCSLWARLQSQTVASSERENTIVKVKDYLGCK